MCGDRAWLPEGAGLTRAGEWWFPAHSPRGGSCGAGNAGPRRATRYTRPQNKLPISVLPLKQSSYF